MPRGDDCSKPSDSRKHDDEDRTYDDAFGIYRDEEANYPTCAWNKQMSVRHSSDSRAKADVADGPSRVICRWQRISVWPIARLPLDCIH